MPAEQTQTPQLYLITPPEIELAAFPDRLARLLDARAIACVRLALWSKDEDAVARAADALRPVCHERDVPLVIQSHFRLVGRLGLDGVHLPDGARQVREVRRELGADAIVGAFCGALKHAGLSAGEAGADYISFGPVAASPLDDGSHAGHDLFAWWSEVVELPCVAERGLTAARIAELAPVVDFFGIGDEIWGAEDAASALAALTAPLG
jgi:thiamine-phosphate pyrophosphorylase